MKDLYRFKYNFQLINRVSIWIKIYRFLTTAITNFNNFTELDAKLKTINLIKRKTPLYSSAINTVF